ncbi:hypothetical protein BX070DRAFT_20017 [Coemansia spiralis]|nr:hypothetical protein BX070DRAFT_20017 [Coemansia spiralis]
MGTLSIQIAHVFDLGTQALTPQVTDWTPADLTAILQWTQHVDLIWPTLQRCDKQKVLAQAISLFVSKRPSATGFCIIDGPTQVVVLRRIICNTYTKDDTRIMALHHYHDCGLTDTIGGLVSGHVEHMRTVVELKGLSRFLDKETHGLGIPIEQCAKYLTDESNTQVLVVAAALIKLSKQDFQRLTPLAFSEQNGAVETMVLQNALLFTQIHRGEQNSSWNNFWLSNLDSLHPHLLARLSLVDQNFGLKYMERLVELNRECQRAMLNDPLDTNVSERLAALAEKWQALLDTNNRNLVGRCLEKDHLRFFQMIRGERVDNRLVFDAFKDVWEAFYAQLQQ